MPQPSPSSSVQPLPRRLRTWARLIWALPPLVVLLTIWIAATGQFNETFYGTATGVAGELAAGHTAGQTFIAQHDGLSGVDLQLATYARVNSGTVVLHLRRDVTHTLDLVTVRVPAQDVANNAWHRFTFPPLANSKGQQYYVELEHVGASPGNAITVYWALNHGDPYPYGRATYDRAPLDGDLTFGLRYDPPPGTLWADLARTLAGQVPTRLFLAFGLALVACPVLLALLVLGIRRGWFIGDPRRVATLGGLLGAFALAHGLIWMVAVPPWQGPDEFAHYAYSALLAAGFSEDDTSAAAQQTRARLEQNILTAMDARGFTRAVSWYATPGGPATGFVNQAIYEGSTMFAETRQPGLYYRLAAIPLRLYASDPAGIPPDVGLYLVRATSVLWATLVVLLAWGCALLLAPGPGFRLLWMALPLLVALLPMRLFIDSMANNDVLGELATTLLVLVLIQWLVRRQPLSWMAVLSIGAGLALIALGLVAKTSTTAAVTPVLLAGGLIGAMCLHAYYAQGRRGRIVRRTLAAGAILLVVIGIGLLATGFDSTGTAQGWYLADGQRAPHTAVGDAHSGAYVLDLPTPRPVFQRVDLDPGHPPTTVMFQVWARPAPGAPPGHLTVTLSGDYTPITATAGTLSWPTGSPAPWQPVTATAILPASAPFVRLLLQSDTPAQIDDATLVNTGTPGPLLLSNPAMEEAGLQLRADSFLGRLITRLPAALQADLILDTLLNPQPFDKGALVQMYLDNENRSYWGWFGWLVVPLLLPQEQYLLWGVISLLALAGWISGWMLRPRLAPAILVLGLVALLALLTGIGATVARQMMLLSMFGLRDFPQGRYLFVLIVPAAWLLLAGLGRLAALLGRRLPSAGGDRTATLMRGGAWLGLNLLLYLDLYALVVLILPYYYGRF